jgi:hypothetical protein
LFQGFVYRPDFALRVFQLTQDLLPIRGAGPILEATAEVSESAFELRA